MILVKVIFTFLLYLELLRYLHVQYLNILPIYKERLNTNTKKKPPKK